MAAVAIAFGVLVYLTLVGVMLLLWRDFTLRSRRNEEATAKLVEIITRQNPANNTLKAMKETAGVITDAVGRVTETIGSSFAAATGIGTGGIIEQPAVEFERDEPQFVYPEHELGDDFAPADFPNGDGFISPPPRV